LVEKIPFFVLSGGSCVATVLAQERAVITVHLLPFGDRVANALVSYTVYIWKMFWPVNLSAVYPYNEDGSNLAQTLLALAILLVLSVIFFSWRKKYPFLVIGWLWFLGMLVPMIGIVQVGAQAHADRYTYLPQIGLYILLTWGAMELFARWRYGQKALAVLGVLILLPLIAVAYYETSFWRNSETLWNHALANTSRNHIALTNLGDVVAKKGRFDESIGYLRKALQIYPNSPEANNDMGYALASKGNWSESIGFYRSAMKVRPNYPKAHNNLAISLSEVGKKDEAMAEFREAIKLDETYADAHCNLGALLLDLGRRDEAVAQLTEALRLKPDDEETRGHLRQLGIQQ
jgi:tetratricopeptide (TPR) repeat protein